MNSKKVKMISSKKEIKIILETGRHFSGKYLKFIYIKKSNLAPQLKLLISVPKKKIKLAVDRNSIKRKIKAFYFRKKEIQKINGNVIIIYNYLKPVKYIKLEKDMLSFQKIVFNTWNL